MELRYPVLIILVLLFVFGFIILTKKNNGKYTHGSKIANTNYLKDTPYFKKKQKEYKILKYLLLGMFGLALGSATILISRLAKVETVNLNQYNRDIFLCMDASTSVDELNIELVESLKSTVSELEGERFGISIFNTSSVILVPLTDDYNYVNDVLDTIKESIIANNPLIYGEYEGDNYFYIKNYIYSGTLEGNELRGSSLIGDGLASCAYSFSDSDSERTKIIIFSTDNDLAGTPLVSLDTAAKISNSKNIKVFGIGTKIMKDEDRTEFKNAITQTGGKFYEHSKSTVDQIVNDIESTSKSLLKNQYETKEFDIPEIPFVILLISIVGITIIGKKVNS